MVAVAGALNSPRWNCQLLIPVAFWMDFSTGFSIDILRACLASGTC